MKKLSVIFMILLIPTLLLGCQKVVTLEDSMSEITKIYFTAETENVSGNISVGQREEVYVVDGKHTSTCDFSLIALKFDELLASNSIEVDLRINDSTDKLVLDLNPANHYYMADLGYLLKGEDNISICFQDNILNFENKSKNFGVDYNKALSLAKAELGSKMDKYYEDKNFAGEGYLKILTGENDEEGQLFWVLTLVANDRTRNNVVLSVIDGRTIISE